MAVRSKDHDFALARPLFLRASHHKDFRDPREARTHLAYVAAEIKTNLDKTMFHIFLIDVCWWAGQPRGLIMVSAMAKTQELRAPPPNASRQMLRG